MSSETSKSDWWRRNQGQKREKRPRLDIDANIPPSSVDKCYLCLLNRDPSRAEELHPNRNSVCCLNLRQSPLETVENYEGDIKYNSDVHILERLQNISDINMASSNKETFLHYAAEYGRFQIVEYLLERGAQPNIRNSKGQTALMAAAFGNHIDVISILCRKSYNTDVNLYDFHGRTALHEANYSTAIFLLRLGERIQVDPVDYDGNTPLHLAVSKVHGIHTDDSRLQNELVTNLLMNGANINARNWKGRTPLAEASIRGNNEIMPVLLNSQYKADINIKDMTGKTALIHAAERSNFKTVEILLNAGADVNCYDLRGFTALHAAAFYSLEDLFCDLLRDLKENTHIKIKSLEKSQFIQSQQKNLNCNFESRDFRGRTARDLEVRAERASTVRGSNELKKMIYSLTDDRGNTILHRLCLNSDHTVSTILEMLSKVLGNRGDLQEILNSTNDRGRTVLHHVADRSNDKNSFNTARALLDAGADARTKDIFGRTAAEYCENHSLCSVIFKIECEKVSVSVTREVDKRPLKIHTVSGFEIMRSLFCDRNTYKNIALSFGKTNVLKDVVPLCYSPNFAYNIWQNAQFAYRNQESLIIREEVTKFVEMLLRFVADKEPLFENRFMLVGSAKENTKINESDEFDFNVILSKLGQCCQIVQYSSSPKGFVHLIKKSEHVSNLESETGRDFFNKDGFLKTDEINSRFQICIQQVLEDRKFWGNENLFDLIEGNHYCEESAISFRPRVCATLNLRVLRKIESKCVFRKISVDIVPCIHIENWRPNYAIDHTNFEYVRNELSLVFDQPQRKYPWIPYSAPYARISFAAMESEIVFQSPAAARAAYMVAKQIIQKAKHSYILKTCLLYCLEAFENRSIEESSIEEVRESELNFWVRKLLKCYLLFCLQDFVPSYFIPDFHLPFTDYAKSNHDLLKILGVTGDNGMEILKRMMKSRSGRYRWNKGYCAKICNTVDGIIDVYRFYWSVCGELTEVEFSIPNPESSKQPFQREDLLTELRRDV